MHKECNLRLFLFLAVNTSMARPDGPRHRRADYGGVFRREMERFLKSAAVAKIGKSTLSGRTDLWSILLEGGAFPATPCTSTLTGAGPIRCRSEPAAYQLAKHLGLGYVPAVIEREIDGIAGSLQAFVENSISEWERRERQIQPGDEKAFTQRMDELKVFDYLVLDSCENVQDILLDQKTWYVYQVDFSEAFAPERAILPECAIERCSRRLYGKLLALDRETVERLLSPCRRGREIRSLDTRRHLIIAAIRKLIAARGEDAVLF